MANKIYPKFKEFALDMLLGAGGSPATPNVKLLLCDAADYTYSDAHQFISDIPVAAIVARSGNLTGKTFTNGIFDANDATCTSVTGDQSEIWIFAIDTGLDATSRLVAYFDTGITNMPVTPNGGDIQCLFDSAGIFQL